MQVMFGSRLRLARKQAGLSMKDLAARLSPPLTAQAISKYEKGQMMPRSSVLVQLGRELDVSLDFLMGGQIEELTHIEFHKQAKTTAQDQARIRTVVMEHLENYFMIEEILGLPPAPDPLGNPASGSVSNGDEIEERAGKLRTAWGMGRGPVAHMVDLLETQDIKVVEADLPVRCDSLACTARRKGNRPETRVVVVARNTPMERKRFNLARAVAYHALPDMGNGGPGEKARYRFAAAFLVPGDSLKRHVGEARQTMLYPELMNLKWLYGVPAAALLTRLGDVGILSSATVRRAFRTYARAWRTCEPEPHTPGQGPGVWEKPLRYKNLVWRALGEELISPVRAAQLLRCSLDAIAHGLRS